MSSVTLQSAATQLSLTVMQTIALSANVAFPRPTSGNGLTSVFDDAAIAAFAVLWSAVMARGWHVGNSLFATAPIALWASTSPGQFYQPPNDPNFLVGRYG